MKKIKAERKFLRRILSVPTAAVLCLLVVAAAGIALAAGSSGGSGPVAVQADADTLAKTLVSDGVTYEDAVILSGSEGYQYATFTGLPEEYYDFSDGIILSNGRADKAFSSGACASYEVGTDYDQYENASDIAGKAYYKLYQIYESCCKEIGGRLGCFCDGAVFAVKLTPSTSALSFRYFFASNEYDQSAFYNDTFALWVVQDFGGAGEKWDNIAKIPEDRLPEGAKGNSVNIQNTCPNNLQNGKYKKDIPGIYKFNNFKTIGYQGCTEALDAEIDTLTPGKPVWVVMAVGDAGDLFKDAAVFVKAKSIKFAKAGEVNITYDANGGTFGGGEAEAVKSAEPGSSYTVGEGAGTPARKGYVFDGWYTAAGDGQKAPGSATAAADTTYYAHWKPVTSTVTVEVKKDGGAMPAGTEVELRKNGATACALTQNGTSWTAAGVQNGVYQVYVDGEDAERSVTVNAVSLGSTFPADEINYYTVTANVTLDGRAWPGQTVALSDGTPLTGSGPYTAVLREKISGNSYTVRVGGEDRGTVAATASGPRTVSPAYHTIGVTLNDTTPWTDASVVLKKGGTDAHRLSYNSVTKKYETILPGTDTAAYDVFVEGRDVGKTVSVSSKTASVTFYTASVKITGGFANMPVSITNGTDSYTLAGGNTSGTAYTCSHVFQRDNNGYAITVGGTIGTVAEKVASAAVVNLTYHTVTFKNASGGTHVTQYVLNGKQAQNVPVPVKAGSAALGWSATSGAAAADFSFSTAVTGNKTLYPVYEAAGIRLGAHIQTGNTSAYTYQLPNLTIKGYQTVSSVVLTVTNCASVTVGSGVTKTASLDTDGNGTVILAFGSGTTGAAAQAKLRGMTVKVKDATKNHTIRAAVYGGQY